MGKRFDSLSLTDYMDSEPIEIKNRELTYPPGIVPKYQYKLFNNKVAKQVRGESYNRAVGTFYEILTAALTGGTWMGLRNSSGNDVVYKPDVISEKGIYDAKSVSWKESCKLQDFQMDKGIVQECFGEYIKPRRKVFIPIFKHGIVEPWKTFDEQVANQGNIHLERSLISLLCDETSFCLFLPFQVAYQFYRPDLTAKEYKSRYDGLRWDHETRLLSGGLKKILLSPEEALSAVNLNPSDFLIQKTKFPYGVTINEAEIKTFPILFMDYRNGNYESWIEGILAEKGEEIEKIRSEKRTRDDYREGREGPHTYSSGEEIDEGLRLILENEHDAEPDRKYDDNIPF